MAKIKAIRIEKVPDELHRTLWTRAAAAGVSLSDHALEELRRSAAQPKNAEVLRTAESRNGPAIGTAEIVAAVRADRG